MMMKITQTDAGCYRSSYLSYKQWKDMVQKEMINQGSTFASKSLLSWRNIFRNSMLWYHVKMSDIKYLKTYKKPYIKKIKVYRDYLMMIVDTGVIYYDIETYRYIKFLERPCLDFEENDYLAVELVQGRDHTLKLHVYRKRRDNQVVLTPAERFTKEDVKFYRLNNELCYVFTSDNILWCLEHKVTNKVPWWTSVTVAHYYESHYDPMINIHIYNDLVYMVTKLGRVWYAETNNFRFLKVHTFHVPPNISQYEWMMFDAFSCAVSVTANEERVKVIHNEESDVILLECSGLTCALQHGDVLILGYNDGTVEIRIPKNNVPYRNNEPERQFNINQFSNDEENTTILGLEVYEKKNSHILFVRTRIGTYQLQLSYPESVL